ncbi:MAG: hypothetical protein ACI8W8_001595 [Rhodothermales bacterium]|jgi:hypothetical protein
MDLRNAPISKRATGLVALLTAVVGFLPMLAGAGDAPSDYSWTRDHMHVGVRWQPFGREQNDRCDADRPVIAEDSSYAQFWVSWGAAEGQEQNTDYANHMSGYLQAIENAVDDCVARGLKTELVFWHVPAWAAVSGSGGAGCAKEGEFAAFMTRIATHFKGRVHAYQLAHEANLGGLLWNGDLDYLMNEVFIKGARAIRAVYAAAPAAPVMVSTSGCSPCDSCDVLKGLRGAGGEAVADYYRQLAGNSALMQEVDGLNLNVSDHFDGYGMMDGSYVTSAWGNFELARATLDAAGYLNKTVFSAESWIVWDDAGNAADVNGDGLKNEHDAYVKTVTLYGQCLQRGLNTMNLPWSDNSSGWAMGLTKRVDYNGRIKELKPDYVIPADDGGPDIVIRKVALHGQDDSFQVIDKGGFTIDDYINPGDPNHLHYYIWRWYAQIAGGSDEVIRHAIAGEIGNDITVWGPGYTGNERYRIASYNRSKKQFTVLIYAGGASGKIWTRLAIPASIQTGRYYNNDSSAIDYRGEGFADGDRVNVSISSKEISLNDGSDVDLKVVEREVVVEDGRIKLMIPQLNKFTTVTFTAAPPLPPGSANKRKPITILEPRIVKGMDINANAEITEAEFIGFWDKFFPNNDKNSDGFLEVDEFPYAAALNAADTNKDGKLTREEYRGIYRSQFRGHDRNKDGRIDGEDEQ